MSLLLIALGELKTLLWTAQCPVCACELSARSGTALDQAKADHQQYGCRVDAIERVSA